MRNIAHRDIKTENLLLTSDFRLKLCDLGSCCSFLKNGKDDITTPKEAIGSPEYNPPEVHLDEISTSSTSLKSADVFALGCVLFLMVAPAHQVVNNLPFKTASPNDPYYSRLIANNTASFWKQFYKSQPNLSSEFKGSLASRRPLRVHDQKVP